MNRTDAREVPRRPLNGFTHIKTDSHLWTTVLFFVCHNVRASRLGAFQSLPLSVFYLESQR